MSNSTKIFNVEEVTGKERSALETTAAEAQIEAPTGKIAREIEANAEKEKAAAQQAADSAKIETNAEKEKAGAQQAAASAALQAADSAKTIARQIETNAEQAAQQAANFAKTIGEEYTGKSMTATDKLQRDASNTTNAAVLEGKKDVDHVKAVGTEYVEQVKALAQSAIETLQPYLPLSVPKLPEGTKINTESQSSSGDIPASLESGLHIVNSTTTTKGGGED